MKMKYALPTNRLATLMLTSLLACGAHAEFNANMEFDNTYLNQNRGLSQSGRVELNAIGKFSNDKFVAAKASFLAKRDGSTATDDMWVQLGSSVFDVGACQAGSL